MPFTITTTQPAISVNAPVANIGEGPSSVVALAGGGYAVAWEANGVIRAQVFDPSGLPVGTTDIDVDTTQSAIARDVTVAALAGGGFVVGWVSNKDNDNDGIFDAQDGDCEAQIAAHVCASAGEGKYCFDRYFSENTITLAVCDNEHKVDGTQSATGGGRCRHVDGGKDFVEKL